MVPTSRNTGATVRAHSSVLSTAYDFGALSPNNNTIEVIPNEETNTAVPASR